MSMLRDITIGQHYPGNSILHRCDPRLKLAATVGYIAALFTAGNLVGVGLALVHKRYWVNTLAAMEPLRRGDP